MDSVFEEVEKQADGGSKTKASWTGILSLNLPGLSLGPTEYHLRAGKAKGSQEKPKIVHVDGQTGRLVESKEVGLNWK